MNQLKYLLIILCAILAIILILNWYHIYTIQSFISQNDLYKSPAELEASIAKEPQIKFYKSDGFVVEVDNKFITIDSVYTIHSSILDDQIECQIEIQKGVTDGSYCIYGNIFTYLTKKKP